LTIAAPWLLPTQNVTGVVLSSTHTCRMFVSVGKSHGVGVRIAVKAPVFASIVPIAAARSRTEKR
jgi:hypothetical protein